MLPVFCSFVVASGFTTRGATFADVLVICRARSTLCLFSRIRASRRRVRARLRRRRCMVPLIPVGRKSRGFLSCCGAETSERLCWQSRRGMCRYAVSYALENKRVWSTWRFFVKHVLACQLVEMQSCLKLLPPTLSFEPADHASPE